MACSLRRGCLNPSRCAQHLRCCGDVILIERVAKDMGEPAAVADDRDPYAEGREAHDAGRSDTANPYDDWIDEEAHGSWMNGWNAAAEAATDDAMEADDVR